MRVLVLCHFARLSVGFVAVMALVFHSSPLAIRHLEPKKFYLREKTSEIVECCTKKKRYNRTEHLAVIVPIGTNPQADPRAIVRSLYQCSNSLAASIRKRACLVATALFWLKCRLVLLFVYSMNFVPSSYLNAATDDSSLLIRLGYCASRAQNLTFSGLCLSIHVLMMYVVVGVWQCYAKKKAL